MRVGQIVGVGASTLALALTATGCTSTTSTPDVSIAPTQPAPSGSPSAGLPAVTAWQPNPNDVQPGVKAVAARAVEREVAKPDTVTQVTNVQWGGILADSASALVTEEQFAKNADGTVSTSGNTFDVRLSRAEPKWKVTAIYPAHPQRAARTLNLATSRLLANPRVQIPQAARADIASGTVDPQVISTLEALSKDHVIGVSVIESGHPINVFGTDRKSNHPQGLAVDIWSIDGKPVVAKSSRELVISVMRQAAALGPYQVGGPVDLDGNSLKYFSDDTHRDHIHLGFRPS